MLSKHEIEQMTDGQREIYYAGVLGERKRIIALLDKHMCLYLYGYTECGGDSDTCVGKEELHNKKLLQLIKGEIK